MAGRQGFVRLRAPRFGGESHRVGETSRRSSPELWASGGGWLGGRDSSAFALRASANIIVSARHPAVARLNYGRAEADGWEAGIRPPSRSALRRESHRVGETSRRSSPELWASGGGWLGGRDSSAFALRASAGSHRVGETSRRSSPELWASGGGWLGGRDSSAFALRAPAGSHRVGETSRRSSPELCASGGGWLGGRDSNPDNVVQSHVSYR